MATLIHPIEIKAENYAVVYHPETCTIVFAGALRLAGMEEYAPIAKLMSDILDDQPAQFTIDLQALNFLNSSGINMLSKFVIKTRQQAVTHLLVLGSQSIPWQGKSLKNLQRLLPTLELKLI